MMLILRSVYSLPGPVNFNRLLEAFLTSPTKFVSER